ncbi:flagellar biosynthesis protein FlhA [Candidatus Paracaedibacter symbiosus]|uniref:flagellar biosynthesis protein FlhA n=1 Tax=Candidatus Paracaedibacter symbiosus TaxID=244582 RepID=UPI0005094D0A|nr:flagellar biosynthesis protein FlhA [Candidatus Paracaedibacter symbiosus]
MSGHSFQSIMEGNFNLSNLKFRTDIAFAIGLMIVLVLLILPVPPILLDLMLAGSIAFSILILLTALFIEKPLDFSAFPTILLVSTMIRMALDVASTRLVLTYGHEGTHAAGKVIQAFGQFIMAGNFVIGIIVFAILVIVNFVVITKGSGRIAEVSARFSLDAMPGKQMAVDADLSAGLIDETEAKRRRKQLEDESNFFGAMDGAAKFVRGDAIASLLITFINIIGGIIIGVAQNDLSFADAMRCYTILTVGDGLVSQVPALIVSTAAGMLVSKAGVEGTADKALVNQLSAYPTALGLSSGVMIALAFLPGMPFLPFFVLAVATGVSAWKINETQKQKKKEEDEFKAQEDSAALIRPVSDSKPITGNIDYIRIEIGYGLLPLVSAERGGRLTEQIKNLRKQLAQEIGFVLPSVRIQDNIQLPATFYSIRIKELEAGRGELRAEQLMVMNPNGDHIDIEGELTQEPTFGLPAKWIAEQQRDVAERLGYTVVDASTVLTTHMTEIVKEHLSELLSYAETQKMLDDLGDSYKRLLNDMVPSQISIGGIQRILQNLVNERVSIRDLPTILEAVSESCNYTRNVGTITEHVRLRLSRQITYSNAEEGGVLKIITLSPKWDQAMAAALVADGDAKQLALPPTQVQEFINDFRKTYERLGMIAETSVLVTTTALRPFLRAIIERVRPATVIMSQNEIYPTIKIQNVIQI